MELKNETNSTITFVHFNMTTIVHLNFSLSTNPLMKIIILHCNQIHQQLLQNFQNKIVGKIRRNMDIKTKIQNLFEFVECISQTQKLEPRK